MHWDADGSPEQETTQIPRVEWITLISKLWCAYLCTVTQSYDPAIRKNTIKPSPVGESHNAVSRKKDRHLQFTFPMIPFI